MDMYQGHVDTFNHIQERCNSVANLVVGMGGERGNKCVGASEWERCLYKDTNGLSKYAQSVHNNWD